MKSDVSLYVGEALGECGFPNGHPSRPDRQDALWRFIRDKPLEIRGLYEAERLMAIATTGDHDSRFRSCEPLAEAFGPCQRG